MATRKINEIFHSLQGEGRHTGRPTVFVRFAGCNLRCGFCDTHHEEGVEMEDAEIAREVSRYGAGWIVLTGGEPTLQVDEAFVEMLGRVTGKRVAIETNGTHPVPANLDWVTVSPKEGAGGYAQPEGGIPERLADEIKVVDCGQDLEQYFSSPWRGGNTLMYLQPCYVPDPETFAANRARTVERVLADPRWTLSLQAHRYLDIR